MCNLYSITRNQAAMRDLFKVTETVPVQKSIHAIVDNYATHKHPKVRKWLARHPRWTFPLHPNFGILAQRCRGLLRQTHQAALEARRLPIGR